jgi:hypothetical protein
LPAVGNNARTGGDISGPCAYGGDNFTYSSTPYFSDVQSSAFGFQWIQKLFELGITAGCATNMYCPNNEVTRDEMAIFIVRAQLGLYLAGSPPLFTYSTTPYFADVPPGEFAFPWIQGLQREHYRRMPGDRLPSPRSGHQG